MKIKSELIPAIGLIILSISGCDFYSQKPQMQSYELKVSETAMTDQTDSLHFAYPTSLALDEKKCIYVLDYQQSSIFKFSSKGRYIQRICGPDHGPGELSSPTEFDYAEGLFIIKDGGNGRIQFVDSLGTYRDSFHGVSLPDPLVFNKNKIYGIVIQDLDKLVTVFDRKGRQLCEFGSLLDFSKKIPLFANNCFLKIYKDHLYILYRYYPIMRIYSLDGELIKEITFPNKEYKENTKQNYDWHSLNKNPNRVPLRFLFRGFDVNSSGVFVGLYHDDLIIDQYDFDGNPIARYVKYHKDNCKHYLYSFRVVDDQKLYFYILFDDDYPQLGILTPDIKRQKM